VIGLVEHGDGDIVQPQLAVRFQVFQPAGCCHHDVDAAAQLAYLVDFADAADDGRHAQLGRVRERLDGGDDLAGQLAGRGEDQAAGSPG